MERILITGGAGFIGSHLAQRLLGLRRRVAILDNLDGFYSPDLKRANLQEARKSGDFELFSIDIRNGQLLQDAFAAFKPDVVIHLAARPGVRPSFAQPEAYTSINILGTTQMLEASRLHRVQKFVFASSSSVYGHLLSAPFREDAAITHPLSIYAATKVAGEAMAFTYAHAYGMSTVCLRLFTVYGPRQRPDLAIRKFAGLIMEGKEVPVYGDGSLQRDYTYIDDIADGILAALESPGEFDVFNLGNSHPIRIDRMIDILADALGKPARMKFLPTPPGEMVLTHADLQRAGQQLRYQPKVKFEEGIRRFAEWMLLQSRANA